MFSIIEMIWLMIILNTCEIQSQPIPTFCETRHFEAVYNLGPKLTFRFKNWCWTYKDNKIIEPPTYESLTILTSLYISQVPQCSDNSEKCNNYKKVQYLAPTRLINIPRKFEYNIMPKIYLDGRTVNITDREVPWRSYFSINGKEIWPMEWEYDKLNSRPAAYWPDKYRMLFIVDSGRQQYSKILFNDITEQYWYKYKDQKLDSDIQFVGMFHYNQVIYAVGDNRHRNRSYDSVLYKLIVTDDYKYIFEQNEIGIKQFFGCGGSPQINTDGTTSGTTNTTTKADDNNVQQNKQTNSAKLAIIILASIIGAAIVCALIIVIVYFVVKKLKPSSTLYVRSHTTDDSVSKDESVVTVTSSREK